MSSPHGYLQLVLRCPKCGKVNTFFRKGLLDAPYRRCSYCGELSASSAWGVVSMGAPFEARGVHYRCQFCGELDCEKDHLGENGQKIIAQYQRRKKELGAKGGVLVWSPLARRVFKGEKDKANSGG